MNLDHHRFQRLPAAWHTGRVSSLLLLLLLELTSRATRLFLRSIQTRTPFTGWPTGRSTGVQSLVTHGL
uniref:Putative secreted protein n=1 Tax=Anopheles darlingi TaxID=43151 RepID=A0A2M4DB57_ANODA